jgi:hypothetical protein
MNEQTITPANEVSFKDFLFKNKRNRTILILAGVAIVVQFAIFKYLYPFANYIHGDSFSYLNAAWLNSDISTYPIGYSRFLRLFSVFSKSDTVLVAFQYLFIETSVIFLLLTIFYFYSPLRITQNILLGFMIFNPLFLHLGNFISSDCFFAALSIYWFTLLLWIVHKPSSKVITWQAVILFIVFTVRYNALIYPLITIFAFLLSPLTFRKKISGMALGIFLCLLFICFSSYKYKKLSGSWQFSPFSGWQLTNNAMYTYRFVDSSERKPVPEKFKAFDNMVRHYFDSTRDINKHPVEKFQASTFYMWSKGLPMMNYRDKIFKNDTSASELKKWATLGPFYKQYGLYIIKQYPRHFLKYFIWPNANKYYAPPVEFMAWYNWDMGKVQIIAKEWFEYKTTKVRTRTKTNQVWILDYFPILSGIINIAMIVGLLFYLQLKGWVYSQVFNKGILIASFVWLLNAAFTISASSAALRFQSFPITLSTTYSVLILDWMTKLLRKLKMDSQAKRKEDSLSESFQSYSTYTIKENAT